MDERTIKKIIDGFITSPFTLPSIDYINENIVAFDHDSSSEVIQQHYIDRKSIGCCSELYCKLNPISYDDFYSKYLSNGQYNFGYGDENHGRTVYDLIDLSVRFYNELIDNGRCLISDLSVEKCYWNIVGHCIHQTFNGKKVERRLAAFLRDNFGLDVYMTYGDFDSKYGVDLICRRDDGTEFRMYIQVKPITFFKGYDPFDKRGLVHDRLDCFEKQKRFDSVFILDNINPGLMRPIVYMVYINHDDGTFLINSNGTPFFTIEELLLPNGKPVSTISRLAHKKIDNIDKSIIDMSGNTYKVVEKKNLANPKFYRIFA